MPFNGDSPRLSPVVNAKLQGWNSRSCVALIIGIMVGGLGVAAFGGGRQVLYTIGTAGSSTVFPLSQEWSVHFSEDYPAFALNPTTGGSGLGQSQIAAGLIDIGATSSYPPAEYFEDHPYVQPLPVAADALAIVVNPAVNGTTFKMDCDMAVAVFQREVTTWEEFESTFGVTVKTEGPIEVYVRADSSGTTATFAKWLETAPENTNANGAEFEWHLGHGESLSWPAGVNSVEGNPGVATGVEDDQNAMGYVGLAFIGGLVPALLYNPGNGEYVMPSVANALKAMPENITDPGQDLMNSEQPGAYPIARLLYYLVNRQNLHWYVIVFLDWVFVRGQKYVSGIGYIPLTGSSALHYSISVVQSLTPTD